MNKTRLLFLVILVEGYVVLASELLAIRQLIPFVGSGTETISIVISAVLMPLAIGYHAGGRAFKSCFAKSKKLGKKIFSVREIILKNIVTSLFILSFGLSYMSMELFFGFLNALGIDNRILLAAIYSMCFLVFPVYKLGQTVPLISNYFSRHKLSEITGKMLFFSTIGSFMGSVFSTIVLMMIVGVHNTVIFTMSLLLILVIILVKKKYAFEVWASAFAVFIVFMMNNSNTMKSLNIVSNNAYNQVQVIELEKENARIININRSPSSKLAKNKEDAYPYIRYIDHNFIDPVRESKKAPIDILVIGSGGFTVGLEDDYNNYLFVDIDKDLKPVAEKYFLKKPLGKNKKFIAASAREFTKHDQNKYDLILVDAYTNVISVPMETTTVEFLAGLKSLLKPDAVLIVNMISSPDFRDKFSVRYNNTFASVFPVYSRQVIGDINPWKTQESEKNTDESLSNNLYIYYNKDTMDDRTVYTEDKNSFSLDRSY